MSVMRIKTVWTTKRRADGRYMRVFKVTTDRGAYWVEPVSGYRDRVDPSYPEQIEAHVIVDNAAFDDPEFQEDLLIQNMLEEPYGSRNAQASKAPEAPGYWAQEA